MQIGGEGIEIYSSLCYNVGTKNFKKTHFHASLLGDGLDRF